MGERGVRNAEAEGSNPLPSIKHLIYSDRYGRLVRNPPAYPPKMMGQEGQSRAVLGLAVSLLRLIHPHARIAARDSGENAADELLTIVIDECNQVRYIVTK